MKEIKVYVVFYVGDCASEWNFQCVTTDFDKWLKQHNEDRGAFTDEEVPIEHKDEFKIFEDTIEVENERKL